MSDHIFSTFSVLCHGQPTLDNILFLYDDKGTPVDAKVSSISQTITHFSFINFSLWTSPTAELPHQCQTSRSSPTPMLQINLGKILCWGLYTITLQTFWFLCFCIRFVYYENLVSTLKQLGVKNDIIDYDGIKLEKQKQTLYGLIEAASLLLTSSGK